MIDLKPFLGTEHDPESTQEAMVIGGWRIATDARILCAVPTDEADTPWKGGTKGPWPIASTVVQIAAVTELAPLLIEAAYCDTCERCNGMGKHECELCGHSWTCGLCHDTGLMRSCRILGMKFDTNYVAKFTTLPHLLVGKVRLRELDALAFHFYGGIGAIMPLDESEVTT